MDHSGQICASCDGWLEGELLSCRSPMKSNMLPGRRHACYFNRVEVVLPEMWKWNEIARRIEYIKDFGMTGSTLPNELGFGFMNYQILRNG